MAHAIQWVKWMDAGEPDECPWTNRYQFKKQRPSPEMEAKARKMLEAKIEIN